MSELGLSPDACIDFDLSVLDFWEWFQGMKAQQVQRLSTKADRLKDKHIWVPKYASEGAILSHYYPDVVAGVANDPIANAITDDELISIMLDLRDGTDLTP